MNSKDFNTAVERQIKMCTDILCKKAAEYADHENDERLHNFKSAAGITGRGAKDCLLGMWMKHLVSVTDMCMSDQHFPHELWDEKLTDTINYALLLAALVEEEDYVYRQTQTSKAVHSNN